MFKTLDAAVEGVLHVLRQAAGRALQVHLLSVLAAGLHKDGVAVFACKAHHLVLDGRAIARAHALDHAAVERAALDVVQNDLVRFRVRVGDPALHLVVHGCIRHEAEGLQLAVRVAGLAFQLTEVDAAAVHAGRGAGLEPAQRQTGCFQAVGQGVGGVHAVRAGRIPRITDENLAAEVRSSSDDHALCAVLTVQLGDNALDAAVLHLDAHHLGLMDGKAGRQLKGVLHIFVVALAIGLHPQGVDGRSLALVQHPALQIGGVGGKAHHAAESIQFTYQRTFCRSADAGVAGHIADSIQAHGKDGGLCAQRRGGVGRFDAGMTGTNDDDIIIS